MATKLYLRDTQTHGLSPSGDTEWWDMVTTPGASVVALDCATTASGTQIQFEKLSSANTVAWISGRVPAGGFTLTSTDFSGWFGESNMSANIGGRYRVYKRATDGTVTELGGGPFDDGVEFSVLPTLTEMTWIGNVTDTAFTEDERILVRVYITNVGTMGGSFTAEFDINAADATTGDSFFNIAETVAFKAEGETLPPRTTTSVLQAVQRSWTY